MVRYLLDVGAVGILEAVLALDDARHGGEVVRTSISVVKHFLFLLFQYFDFN